MASPKGMVRVTNHSTQTFSIGPFKGDFADLDTRRANVRSLGSGRFDIQLGSTLDRLNADPQVPRPEFDIPFALWQEIEKVPAVKLAMEAHTISALPVG